MPAMASITVKKADNTTDIIYDQLTAAGSDGTPAVWRQDTGVAAGVPVGLRTTFKSASAWNGPKTARQVTFEYTLPYRTQDSTTTLYSASDKAVFKGIFTLPQAIPATELNEAAAQFGHLMASALIKSVNSSGYAPV